MKIAQRASTQWQDFKKFALKGSLIDLAVAVVIGGAFGKVVGALVKNVFMPLLSYVTPNLKGYQAWKIGRVEIGDFLAELFNFLLLAVVLYIFVVKVFGAIQRATAPPAPGEPTTKECPYCLSTIPIKAVKCAQCTADLERPAPAP
jgi:large conductance mechanosensitive channel